jgi:hypothetical protein
MGSTQHCHVLASKRGIWHRNALDCCTRHQRRVEAQQGAAAVALKRTALATGLLPLKPRSSQMLDALFMPIVRCMDTRRCKTGATVLKLPHFLGLSCFL